MLATKLECTPTTQQFPTYLHIQLKRMLFFTLRHAQDVHSIFNNSFCLFLKKTFHESDYKSFLVTFLPLT